MFKDWLQYVPIGPLLLAVLLFVLLPFEEGQAAGTRPESMNANSINWRYKDSPTLRPDRPAAHSS